MNALFRRASLTLLSFGLSCTAAPAATVFSQAACSEENDSCGIYATPSAPFPYTLRSFTFNAPGAGRAEVIFNGTMICEIGLSVQGSRVVDLVTQITTGTNQVPTINGHGGLRHGIVLLPHPTIGSADTFSLASARPFVISSAGPKSVYFRIDRLRMDADTFCSFYNMAFTVEFTP